MHGKFTMKERTLLSVGAPDSRKTSWFAPFQGEYCIYFNTFRVMLSKKHHFHLPDCDFKVL